MSLNLDQWIEHIAQVHEGLQALHRAFSSTDTIAPIHREQLQALLAQATALHTALLDARLAMHGQPVEATFDSDKELILIVEDDEHVRLLLKQHLKSAHIDVHEATSAEEALQIAESCVPDLIISDIIMNGMDGYTLCKVFKTRLATSHIPIILLTAKNELEAKLQGLEVGADDYIYKPFNLKELTLRVHNLLSQRKSLRDAFFRQFTQTTALFSQPTSPKEDPFITKVRTAIERHLSDETYSVDRLAYEVCLSRVQLFRKLKSLIGLSPIEFISSLRLTHAAKLLQTRNMSVAEVCLAVGFGTNYSYFARRFKERFGVPPSEFLQNPSTKM